MFKKPKVEVKEKQQPKVYNSFYEVDIENHEKNPSYGRQTIIRYQNQKQRSDMLFYVSLGILFIAWIYNPITGIITTSMFLLFNWNSLKNRFKRFEAYLNEQNRGNNNV